MKTEFIDEELDFFVWLIRDELEDYTFHVNKKYINILSINPLRLEYKTKSILCQYEYKLEDYTYTFKLYKL